MNAVVRNIAEKYVAFRIDGGPFRELVTLAHQLPIFVWIENVVGEKMPLAGFRLGDRLRVVAPKPAQGVRQDGRAMLAVVPLGSHHQLAVVPRMIERQFQLVITIDIHIRGTVLEEHAQRPGLHFADQRRIDVTASKIRETANEAEHASERIGTAECRVE